MKVFTPEISWHNRLPTLSLDISKPLDDHEKVYRLATGGNDCRVYIWHVEFTSSSVPDIRIRAGLRRHHKSVGAVRFSPDHLLASGDDDGYIYIWKHKDDCNLKTTNESSCFLLNDDGFEDLETWQQQRVLRGHIEDICDLTWSDDGLYLLSGSVDNSAIFWDAVKGTKLWCSDLIKGYVQGVALDPHMRFIAAISSDRSLRIYNYNDKKSVSVVRRINIRKKYKAFFCDDTVQTFCRRFEFSPDSQFLIVPTSRIVEVPQVEIDLTNEIQETENGQDKAKKPFNAFLVFRCTSFTKPISYYPTGREVALCCRFCPVLYELRDNNTNFWDLPYRLVFAIATSRSILIYDSQQPTPIGYISKIHLARLTDLAWSNDGRLLMVSSYDGYCTLVTFDRDEFGKIYIGPMIDRAAIEKQKSTNGKSHSSSRLLDYFQQAWTRD